MPLGSLKLSDVELSIQAMAAQGAAAVAGSHRPAEPAAQEHEPLRQGHLSDEEAGMLRTGARAATCACVKRVGCLFAVWCGVTLGLLSVGSS